MPPAISLASGHFRGLSSRDVGCCLTPSLFQYQNEDQLIRSTGFEEEEFQGRILLKNLNLKKKKKKSRILWCEYLPQLAEIGAVLQPCLREITLLIR